MDLHNTQSLTRAGGKTIQDGMVCMSLRQTKERYPRTVKYGKAGRCCLW